MKGWRFSWRSVGGWLAGAVASGGAIGLMLAVVNILLSPEDKDEFPLETAVLVLGGIAVLLVLSGLPELVSSLVWRFVRWWSRPWAEMILCAAICFGLVHAPAVDINFDFDGAQASWYNALVFFCMQVAPVLAGLLAPFVYWLIAKPKRD